MWAFIFRIFISLNLYYNIITEFSLGGEYEKIIKNYFHYDSSYSDYS